MNSTTLVLALTLLETTPGVWCDTCALPSRVVIVVVGELRRLGSAVGIPTAVQRHEHCESCGEEVT